MGNYSEGFVSKYFKWRESTVTHFLSSLTVALGVIFYTTQEH